MKAYNVVLYPTPGYFRHFLVFAESPKDAVYKLNHQSRIALSLMQKNSTDDSYGRLSRLKHIIKATRRWQRKHKPTWAHRQSQFCVINEIPTSVAHEGQLTFGCHTDSLIQNFLPNLNKLTGGNGSE